MGERTTERGGDDDDDDDDDDEEEEEEEEEERCPSDRVIIISSSCFLTVGFFLFSCFTSVRVSVSVLCSFSYCDFLRWAVILEIVARCIFFQLAFEVGKEMLCYRYNLSFSQHLTRQSRNDGISE